MRSKTVDLYLNILNSDYDLICLTETNLDGGVYNEEMFDERYNVFRRDRLECNYKRRKKEGGGVLIAVRRCYTVLRQLHWESCYEDLWISIVPTRKGELPLNVCVCYLPSYLETDDFEEFTSRCQRNILDSTNNGPFIILGDFNIPEIDWFASSGDAICSVSDSSKASNLKEMVSLCDLAQFNLINNQNGRILDLVLSNVDNGVRVEEATPLLKLDRHHPSLLVSLDTCEQSNYYIKANNDSLKPNFHKCDYVKLKAQIGSINWYELLNSLDPDTAVECFYHELQKAILLFTPLKKCSSTQYPYWYSYTLRRCLREKFKYHKRYKMFGNQRDYDTFALLRSRSKVLINECYRSLLDSVEDNFNDNMRGFWKFVNSKKSSKSLPQNMSYNNNIATDSMGICNLFSQYFSSVYASSGSANTSQYELSDRYNLTLSRINVSYADILASIRKLDTSKGPGPDGIPAIFVRNCAEELCIPLSIIFNKSLSTGNFPQIWKTAYIIPIFKSGDKTKCENYRPISILSCLAKLFESLVYSHLYNHVKQQITTSQHGFVAGRSTISNLLVYKNYICSAFAKRGQIDAVYTDFSKAFDRVNHQILSAKLSGYGIHGSLLRWFESYVARRNQVVAIRGHLSAPSPVPMGVPQGSHLGPLLFIIFINDIVDYIDSCCLLYADDMKLFRTISDTGDCLALQRDIDAVSEWCTRNHLDLNISKCFTITFTTRHSATLYNYTIKGQHLKRSEVAKDLGVYFDSKLNFRAHFNYIINRGFRMQGFIIRASKGLKKPLSLLRLYCALVRPILEYATVVWSPFYNVHSQSIERVQKSFLRSVCGRFGLLRCLQSYASRVERFKLPLLSKRRDYNELIYLHKIIHSSVDCPELLSQINFNAKIRQRVPRLFYLDVYKNNTSFYNPIVKMCRAYDQIKHCNSHLDVFNSRINIYKSQLHVSLEF